MREHRKTTSRLLEAIASHDELTSKALGLIAAKDALAYQSIQYMDPESYTAPVDYDPSDEGEQSRIDARGSNEGDELNAEERAIAAQFDQFFVPGE